jgi:hypothetical protein
MSETAPEAAAGAPRRENVFTHKIGPLPMWGWLAIILGGLVAWRIYASKNAATQAQQQGATAPGSTADNTVPQFVNQTYVTTTAPPAPTPSPTDRNRPPWVDPGPVGGWPGEPKPTTTLPGSWFYPAPQNLRASAISDSGYSLNWNAVTGPTGQHPNSYTVATYDTKNKLVDQFIVGAGNTATKEYGKGGKGLPKGTYHSNVWANGGPVAPPHSTVQVSVP